MTPHADWWCPSPFTGVHHLREHRAPNLSREFRVNIQGCVLCWLTILWGPRKNTHTHTHRHTRIHMLQARYDSQRPSCKVEGWVCHPIMPGVARIGARMKTLGEVLKGHPLRAARSTQVCGSFPQWLLPGRLAQKGPVLRNRDWPVN